VPRGEARSLPVRACACCARTALNCHTPHGSNQATLLVAPVPFLCQQCHTNFLHPNDLQTRQDLGTGSNPDERIMDEAASPVTRTFTGRMHLQVCGSMSSAQELEARTRAMRELKVIALASLLSVPVFGWAEHGSRGRYMACQQTRSDGWASDRNPRSDGTSWLAPGQHRSPTGTCTGLPRQSRIRKP